MSMSRSRWTTKRTLALVPLQLLTLQSPLGDTPADVLKNSRADQAFQHFDETITNNVISQRYLMAITKREDNTPSLRLAHSILYHLPELVVTSPMTIRHRSRHLNPIEGRRRLRVCFLSPEAT